MDRWRERRRSRLRAAVAVALFLASAAAAGAILGGDPRARPPEPREAGYPPEAGAGSLALRSLLDRPAPHQMPPGVLEWPPLARRLGPLPALPDPPRVPARAAILVEADSGAVLYAKRADRPMHPASTTKILTALLVLERGNLDDVVTVSARAAITPGSSMGLRAGLRIRLEDLLYGILLASGNDAAVAAAEHLAGSVQAFADWMNQRAWELGALSSHFENPHGLTAAGHMTTARDLAILAARALQHRVFREIACTPAADVCTVDPGWIRILTNTNRLLGRQGVEGVKTGTTSAAGNCLVASAVRDGVRLIAVVLDASDRYEAAGRLLEWGFSAIAGAGSGLPGEPGGPGRPGSGASGGYPGEPGDYAGSVPVLDGEVRRVPSVLAGRLMVLRPALGPEDPAPAPVRVTRRVHPVAAPVAAGDPVGRLEAWAGGRVVGHAWLVASREVGLRRWWPPWGRAIVRRPWPARLPALDG